MGCLQTTTAVIPVELYIPSTISGTISPICLPSPPINLTTALPTSTLGPGVWSGPGVTGTTFDPSIAGTGNQILTYGTNPGSMFCSSTSSIAVLINSASQPIMPIINPMCTNGPTLALLGNPTGGTWQGSGISALGILTPSLATTGTNTYTYTVGSSTCSAFNTTTITIVQYAPVLISQPLGSFCIYDPAVNLQSITPTTGGVWSGTGVTGNYFTPALAGAGTYTISYTTNPSPLVYCGGVGTTTVVVNAKPEANAYPNITEGCNPVLVNYATSTVPTGLGIWDFGDGTARDTGLQVSHLYNVPGTYTATLYYTDDVGCKDTTVATSGIEVFALPVASFEPSLTETTVVDGQVQFTNHSTVLNDNTYSWDIGNGMYTSANLNEAYEFTHSGLYVVSLFATTSKGCVDDTSVVIRVNPDVVLYVPNAFTPGSDGLNDVFYIGLPPSGVDYSTFHLTIYDRWGELVYETNDVTMYWNGAKHNSGPVLKQEVYVWKISFEDEKKQYYEKMGHVSLLRK
ncbi:MAG: gliding motility-associated C-terminal domain-containing protein [Bacteroidetes bacterium]|nr:gliding motility-associated C-terminal domain-containing protein [Bacteroidota bacterium]